MQKEITSPHCDDCRLLSTSVFSKCDITHLSQILGQGENITIKKGEFLLNSGDSVDGVYCINKGSFRITKSGSNEKSCVLWYSKPGEIVGLNAYLNEEKYAYEVMAVRDSSLCYIPRDVFDGLIAKEADLKLELMRMICKKINFIESRMANIMLKNTTERLIEMLLFLIRTKDRQDENNFINYTLDELADLIGTTQSYLYKTLLKFSKAGIVRLEQQRLRVLSEQGLENWAK